MPDAKSVLAGRLQAAFDTVEPGADPVLRASDRADYQANGALALAKRLGRNPREVADAVVAAAELADVCEAVEVSGPGFVNLTFSTAFVAEQVARVATDDRLGIEPVRGPRDGGGRLLGSERGEGDARRQPSVDDHRRRALPAAGPRRRRRPPREPHRRLGDAVRDAHRALGRPRRGRGGARAVGRRPRPVLPGGEAVVRRRRRVSGPQPPPGRPPPVRRSGDRPPVAPPGGRERPLLRRRLRQARRAAASTTTSSGRASTTRCCRPSSTISTASACWSRTTARFACSRPASPTGMATRSR